MFVYMMKILKFNFDEVMFFSWEENETVFF